jgi:hypothetical protein
MIPLESALAPRLKALGFRKKARTWWRDAESSIQVINLQKSGYGAAIYVNRGIYLNDLGAEPSPPERRCHIRSRLERVVGPELCEVVRSADAESAPTSELIEAVVSGGVGWLSDISTHDGLSRFLASEQASGCFVHRDVRGR